MKKHLSLIPKDDDVMLDANMIVYALQPASPYHESCRELLEHGFKKTISLHTTVHVVSDVIHRIMVEEIREMGLTDKVNPATFLKKRPQIIPKLNRYKTVLRDLKRVGLDILPVSHQDLHGSRIHREQHGLMANDSLIVAVMRREKIQHLATNDRDFERVPDIKVWYP
ncbi:MAG: type II toxin-antitoxin system VapC family toxin [Chloroflexota bacterium]